MVAKKFGRFREECELDEYADRFAVTNESSEQAMLTADRSREEVK
jgi:hypothetical protein